MQTTPIHHFVDEFNKFFRHFEHYFIAYRRSVAPAIKSYLSGLLRQIPRKNIERIDETVPENTYHRIHHAISDSAWDEQQLNAQTAREVNRMIGGSRSALVLDDTSVTKKGEKSVGVTRQRNSRLGKVDNCQTGVYAALCRGGYNAVIGYRLYLPTPWSGDARRCEEAGIPEEARGYKRKADLALELVDEATERSMKFGIITGDVVYGSLEFGNQLAQRGHLFAVDIQSNTHVYLHDPQPSVPDPKSNKGRAPRVMRSDAPHVSVESIAQQLDQKQWTRIRVWKGTKGQIYVYAYARRVFFWNERTGYAPAQWWVVVSRDQGSEELSYFMSNAPATWLVQHLVRNRRQRFWIERSFQDTKTSLGMADYQVRKWRAWQHHMAIIMLAHLFMMTLKMNHTDESTRYLSCEDIVVIMDFLFPRQPTAEQDLYALIQARQRKRKDAQQSAVRCQKRRIRCEKKESRQ